MVMLLPYLIQIDYPFQTEQILPLFLLSGYTYHLWGVPTTLVTGPLKPSILLDTNASSGVLNKILSSTWTAIEWFDYTSATKFLLCLEQVIVLNINP